MPGSGSMMRAMMKPTSVRGVELAGALAAALGELADQVLVAAADDVGLDVFEPEAFLADALDEVAEAVVVEVALTPWVVALKSTRSMMPFRSGFSSAMARRWVVTLSPILSESVRMTDQTGSSGFVGLEGKVEADELLVALDELEGFGARADLARRCG